MNEGLEALERIIGCSTIESHTKKWQQDYLIVEQELKRLEELEKAFVALSKDDEKAKKLLSKEIEKNRALEIIKNKGVDVSAVIQIAKGCKSYITYNNHLEKYKGVGDLINQHRKPLIKEEWNLLKEVLL